MQHARSTLLVLPPWTASAVLASGMLAMSAAIGSLGGSGPAPLVLPYLAAALTSAAIATGLFALVEGVRLARNEVDRPVRALAATIAAKLPMLAIPAIVLPLFLAGYSAAKSAIPDLAGFRFDAMLAGIDLALFGTDPWRITHALIGPTGSAILEFLYGPVWIAALAYSGAVMALFADRRLAMTFFTASLLTWFVGGFVLAYLLSSAGPTFTGLNGLEEHFGGLRAGLAALNGADSAFVTGPAYLERGVVAGRTQIGGGISAMPSMHVAVCALYCLAASGTRYFTSALAFLAAIVVGSVHSGYHYAVDAPVAVAVAVLCWKAASLLHGWNEPLFDPATAPVAA